MIKSIPKTIDYVEIPSRDIVRSRAFFSELLGWAFTDYGPDYTSFEDGRISGGIFKSEKISRYEEGAPLPVIYSEALEKSKADVIRLGGKITRDIFSFPGGRRFHFTEPGGSEFGVWSDASAGPDLIR
jgi:predicted enzyme related to lactoylglutathione lyase